MKPRNTIPKTETAKDDKIACAFPMRRICLTRYAPPAPDTKTEAAFRSEKGEMLRRELLAFADTMQRIRNPKQRERLATLAADLIACAWADEAKTYERVGRETIKRIWHQRVAEDEAEYLKEAGYAMN